MVRDAELKLDGVAMHLGFKPVLKDISLEPPLAADLRGRHPAFPRELVDRHHVKAQVLRHFAQGHDLIFLLDAVFHAACHRLSRASADHYRKYT